MSDHFDLMKSLDGRVALINCTVQGNEIQAGIAWFDVSLPESMKVFPSTDFHRGFDIGIPKRFQSLQKPLAEGDGDGKKLALKPPEKEK